MARLAVPRSLTTSAYSCRRRHWQAGCAVDAVPLWGLGSSTLSVGMHGSERLRQPRGLQNRESRFDPGHSRQLGGWPVSYPPLIDLKGLQMMSLKAKILALRQEGKSFSEIKKALGCSKATVSYYCSGGQREKNIRRQKTRRNKYRRVIQELKTGQSCLDCGVEYPPHVLDFDHRPGEVKLFNITALGKVPSMKVFLAEIAKCDIVCANCHRQRTWERVMLFGGLDYEDE